MAEEFVVGGTYRHVPVQSEIRAVDKEERIYDFVASTTKEDRHGTRLFGWELENYHNNSVILWSHEGSLPPIGRALRTWVDDGKLKIRIQFPPEGVYELADTVRGLVEHGYLRSGSVGFIPGRVVFPWEREEDERGEDDSIHLLDNELVEFSLTPVPSNPDALAAAFSRGLIPDSVGDCFVANKNVGGSFGEVREALEAWMATALPEDDPELEALRSLPGESDPPDMIELADAEMVAIMTEERNVLWDELCTVSDLLDAALEEAADNSDHHASERAEFLTTIKNLNRRISDLEGATTSSDMDRRLSNLEHRSKAQKVISVEEPKEEVKEVPHDFLARLDRLTGS